LGPTRWRGSPPPADKPTGRRRALEGATPRRKRRGGPKCSRARGDVESMRSLGIGPCSLLRHLLDALEGSLGVTAGLLLLGKGQGQLRVRLRALEHEKGALVVTFFDQS